MQHGVRKILNFEHKVLLSVEVSEENLGDISVADLPSELESLWEKAQKLTNNEGLEIQLVTSSLHTPRGMVKIYSYSYSVNLSSLRYSDEYSRIWIQ